MGSSEVEARLSGEGDDDSEAEQVTSRARLRIAELLERPFDIRSLALTGLFILALFYTIYFLRSVLLPVVLACYEFWMAEKRSWKPLIPFFAVSLSFGLQGVLLNQNVDNDYTFRFTPAAFWTTLRFYSSKLFLIPYAGLALLPLPFLIRDRRLWFGAAIVCLFFIPLMFLPGRLFSAYCYLPLAGFALMAATLAEFGEEIAAASPLGRIGRPDDMAGVAVFLSARAGAYVTGAIIPVDGGIWAAR